MEGDAGTSQLNPINEDESLVTPVTDEDSKESESGAEATSAVTAEGSTEAEAEATDTEATDTEATDTEVTDTEATDAEPAGEPAVERRKSRVGRAWLLGIAAVLLILAGCVGFGGYYALRAHRDIAALQRNDAAALNVAKDCVAATQAPDISSMAASEQKIVDCGTDQYRTQALLYSSMLVQAYQAANVHLKVSDMRAAVERNNPDGSVDILIALRISVSNDQQQNQETGYRLRVRMAPTDGTYKISKLDQVTK
ncbi:Mce protein [Mycobacterium sp. TY814]|uniref:Mce protein n=1 Tax=unclassified Mycobacterium TaxID=2642494 RepID=UPI002741B71F|nr:Mce protein [Mycobacterium sp. TY814]MDP7722945.1 Mce protein [Mycobacterium sp. TY814]